MNNFEAIETVYNGHRFRSRLEARWAIFFDILGIKWVYEPEGFVLSDKTCYLPDFYLPESDSFFEVKGIMSDKDMHKIEMLIKDANKQVVIGYSDFTFQSCNFGDWMGKGVANELTDPSSSVLVHCSECGKWYFSGSEYSYECRCCHAHDGDHYFYVRGFGDKTFGSSEVNDAISQAQQARFEYGENGINDYSSQCNDCVERLKCFRAPRFNHSLKCYAKGHILRGAT